MSRLITKQEKKVVLDKKGKDFVVIRPLSRDEMLALSDLLGEPIMLHDYLQKVRQLLDRDPNKEVEKILNEQIEKIKEYETNKTKKSKIYNDNLLLKSIVKIVDDGKRIDDHEFYLKNIDNVTYQQLIKAVMELNIPSMEKMDFLGIKAEK